MSRTAALATSRTSWSSPASPAPGKSSAMNVFEDAGYFCVDNLPAEMIRSLAELFLHEGSKVERAARRVATRAAASTCRRSRA